jgi:hypothetical protein
MECIFKKISIIKLKSSDKKELTKSEVKIKNSVNGTKRKLSIKEKK